ncbi:DNA-3-methyladenine glycosylase family protein [Paenisporosarcina cavernae]|uniref:DNA-3-methyladenine glycosylase II n=1 Tax=Paenisporosarcina cavernae TaxID=2320858 RepID=A0A385YTD4_9BACL|nr:DNA-3-methyladenine glycosylase [Paenisporosarcina cavernae]AYC30135.1 DNA-3-methyladenine glycosylase 2 family protein [Paenisporosarcina cavernae]
MIHQFELDFVYDFDKAISRLSRDPLIYIRPEEKLVKIPLENSVATLKSIGTFEQPAFELSGNLTEEDIARVKSIFHFDRSLDPIHAHFRNTNLAEVFDQHRGTPIVKEFSLYATLMKSIIHQQLNLAFAHTLTTRFVENYGTQKEGVWLYPTPERTAEIPVEELRALQFSQRKAEYVIDVSKAIASGTIELDTMEQLPDEEIVETLVKLRGIGPWTAGSFLLFGLGRPNLFPVADVGLQNALKKLWKLEQKPTAEEMQAHFPEWEPYLSYASLYLWRTIE